MTAFPARGRITANWMILIAALAAALGLWLGMRLFAPAPMPQLPPLQSGMLFPHPRSVPTFELARSDGGKLTEAELLSHWTLVFFGYTHCPDVCPTTIAAFAQAWKKLEPAERARLRFVFISVDPARDTPEHLGQYIRYFDKEFIAATGSDDVLTPLTRALGLLYSRGTAADGNYLVDHSASVVMIDPLGREVGLLRPPFETPKLLADLQALARSP
ncbi:MAG: SCO family protein [Dokdonella sp.]|uniref:SCO family protein n=1 Tax=Dokdonella sp. TaxID=2291710 RepID=UPI0025BC1351|nr:SCO family protein [Dokdonella sp.]MBZ0222223.1 SCO family protein [Dokdonella sp.]MCC7254866.1 SCO family protein [Dokdonella sp.]